MRGVAGVAMRGVTSVTNATPLPSQATEVSWPDIVARVGEALRRGEQATSSSSARLEQLTGLLRLQVDVSRYQLKIELVSKVSEAAVASLRKLQQNG